MSEEARQHFQCTACTSQCKLSFSVKGSHNEVCPLGLSCREWKQVDPQPEQSTDWEAAFWESQKQTERILDRLLGVTDKYVELMADAMLAEREKAE